MQFYAGTREGKCLSKEYAEMFSKLIWKCKQGHVFERAFAHIQQGSWCMQCAKNDEKKIRLNKFHELAHEQGCECLSTTYANLKTQLLFKCHNGHCWKVQAAGIKRKGIRCPICSYNEKTEKRKKKYFNIYTRIVKNRGGQLLSTDYVNNATRLQLRCAQGHEWWALPNAIQRGQWCFRCFHTDIAEKQKDSIKIFIKIAKDQAGKLLSKTYVNCYTKLKWKCKAGHVWWSKPHNIKNGKWCPQCATIRSHKKSLFPLEVYAKIAEKRGGKILSKEYKNINSRVEWLCGEGHRWVTALRTVRRGKWCPICARNKRRKK